MQRVPPPDANTPDILSGCEDLDEEHSEAPRKDLEKELESVERRIEEVGQRLKQIKGEKEKCEVDSEEYGELERERNVLRKEVVDLDSIHRQIFVKFKKQNQEEVRKSFEEDEKHMARSRKQGTPQREEQHKHTPVRSKAEEFEEREARIEEIKKEILASRMKRSQVKEESIASNYSNPFSSHYSFK